MNPKKIVTIISLCTSVISATTVGFLYTTDAEMSDIVTRYHSNTQDFERTNVDTVISELVKEEQEPQINDPDDTSGGDDHPQPPGPEDLPSATPPVVPEELSAIIGMSFDEAYNAAVGGIGTYNDLYLFNDVVKAKLLEAQKACGVTITVPAWRWKSSDASDYTKESYEMSIYCNKLIVPLVQAAMTEIYNHPDKPIMMFDGCYYVREMRNSDPLKTSAHSYGCAIDFNSTSAVNGKGNTFGESCKISKAEWEALPESKAKYEIFYPGCPVVETFYKYGFYWGGVWTKSDGMHFGFIGDSGRDGRKIGQANAKGKGIYE